MIPGVPYVPTEDSQPQEGNAEVPTPVHPVADEATDRWLVYDTTTALVALTEPVRVFLEVAATDGLRPVLVTHPEARLSPFAASVLAEAGGSWVVRADDGAYEATTGQPLGSFADLWRPPTGQHPHHATRQPPGHVQIAYDLYTTQRADHNTQVGRTAQSMTRALGGTGLDLWGTAEPLSDPFDTAQVTAFARTRMPRTPALLATGPDTSHAQVWVGRTHHGLLERTTGGVMAPTQPPEPPGSDPALRTDELVQTAADALATIAEQENVTVALTWATVRNGDATTPAAPRAADRPLAVLIGPRAVHDLGADLTDLASRHDAQVLGRARIPALLVRFSAPGTDLWAPLRSLVVDLGPANIARAARLDTP